MIEKSFRGSTGYWVWVVMLLAISAAGFGSYMGQLTRGLGITGMGRDVSWGLYIANFTFFVGVAASAVMVVLPYYLHRVKEFRKIVILGEFLAVAAVVMSVLFIFVDLGQPGRVFNIIRYPSPRSLLFWDMIVLNGYLFLNLLIGWSTLDAEHKDEPVLGWVKPLIILSIPWAVSIHTVTAFIYQGLAARPSWYTALWAPRFLASAFASGPSLLILMALLIRRMTPFDPGLEAIRKVAKIVTYALLATIFLFLVELFTILYGDLPHDLSHLRYLFLGLEGHSGLVPWMWTSVVLMVLAAIALLAGGAKHEGVLAVTCLAVFVAVWIDKGLGLIVPGFVPSPLGQITDYVPTLAEALITAGIWAVGFLIVTVFYKVTVGVRSEE